MNPLIFAAIGTAAPLLAYAFQDVLPESLVIMVLLLSPVIILGAMTASLCGVVMRRFAVAHIILLVIQGIFLFWCVGMLVSKWWGSDFEMDYGRVRWEPINPLVQDSYTFGLSTSIQDYTVEKKGQELIVTARGQHFSTPRDKQKPEQWSFTRTLPQGDAFLEQLISRIWQVGVCEVENELHVEGVCCAMSLAMGGKWYSWDLVQEPVSQKMRPLYAQLNEYFYQLFPEAQKYPACFPMSDHPPAHIDGDAGYMR